MKYITLILFLTILNFSYGQKNIDTAKFEIKLQLIEKIDSTSLPPYCGTFMSQQTFKYKVIDPLSSQIKDSVIYVNHICIRELYQNNGLVYNKTYTLSLKKSKKEPPFNSCNLCLKPKKINSISYDAY